MMAWFKSLGRLFFQDSSYVLNKDISIPKHIAIIMDGNGRWAKKRGMPRLFGHHKGVDVVRQIVRYAGEIGVEHLTLYAFSYENWKRPQDEVSGLLDLIRIHLTSELEELNKNNVRIRIIGQLEMLPQDIQKLIKNVKDKTKKNTGLVLSLALSYSAKQEIISGIKSIVSDIQNGKISSDINEEIFSSYLYTSNYSDPELLIRTSGEQRLSNFLLWQCAYSELYFSSVYWPDFSKEELIKAIEFYQSRNRRYGGI